MRRSKLANVVARYVVVSLLALLFVIPLLWQLSTTLKDPLHVFARTIEWIPETPHWENYVLLFTQYHFEKYIANTLVLCLLNVVGTVVSTSLVAYAFAFGRYRHKNKVFVLVLGTMMLPGAVTFFPQFILYSKIGWYGTTMPLWVPSFFGSAFYIFFLRQYFLTIPSALLDAARVDGCSDLRMLLRIVVPMSRPVYLVMIVNTFVGVWGDFFNQLIYLTRADQYTVSIGLTYLNSTYGAMNNSTLPILMAGSVVVSIPVLIVYYIGQKKMMDSYVFREVEK